MRVPLPEGYVPPEPTHPFYGYLTPDEMEAYEAEQRAPSPSSGGKSVPEPGPLLPPLVSEAEEATVAHTGWVPEPPPEPAAAVAVAPAGDPASLGEYSWDAHKQEWVRAAPRSPDATEEPQPDVAAAAGGRGASSSWTAADGQRFRWDARRQRWITEPEEGSA